MSLTHRFISFLTAITILLGGLPMPPGISAQAAPSRAEVALPPVQAPDSFTVHGAVRNRDGTPLPSATPTNTPSPTPTSTATPSASPTPTDTPTSGPSPTSTNTSTPTDTA
ncbi:MAG TPA: hypothetical protein VJG32_09995, partial [Anaerolineae bacterium]|nr:hypothetical protein [Anaerolineae bacterium]